MKTSIQWVRCSDRLPPDGEVVMTKIDDRKGCRNEQELTLRGRLWFFPGESMYVYYEPTHWAAKTGGRDGS